MASLCKNVIYWELCDPVSSASKEDINGVLIGCMEELNEDIGLG